MLLVFFAALALVVAVAASSNEVVRRRIEDASELTVEEFTRELSADERLGWKVLPRYTALGYLLQSLPPTMRAELLAWHAASEPRAEASSYHLEGTPPLLASLANTELERSLERWLRSKLEAWTGQQLSFVNSYGPRTYRRASSLKAHSDRLKTHAVSAIVYLDSDAQWPLQFVPNGAPPHAPVAQVLLRPEADVLLYESMQPHGRVTPFPGRHFTAMFFHWMPDGWEQLVQAARSQR